jgi:hypothetical protein
MMMMIIYDTSEGENQKRTNQKNKAEKLHFILENLYIKLQSTLQTQKNDKKFDQKKTSSNTSNHDDTLDDDGDAMISTNNVITEEFDSSLEKKDKVSEKLALIEQCIPLMPSLCDHLQFIANQLQIIDAGDAVDQIVCCFFMTHNINAYIFFLLV